MSVTTLDQSIVTYPISEAGPVRDEIREFMLPDPTEFNPILPIAHTGGDIVLSGTSIGDIPVVKSGTIRLPFIRQGEHHGYGFMAVIHLTMYTICR
jgi:hypothetical protein